MHDEQDVQRSLDDTMSALRQAFTPHSLDPQGAVVGWIRGYLDAEQLLSEVQGKPWTELDPRLLDFHGEAVHALRPPAFVELIPAFLSTVLLHNPSLEMLPVFLFRALTRPSEPSWKVQRFEENFSSLSDAQRRAVADALKHLARFGRSDDQRAEALAALESAWRSPHDSQDR